MKKFIFEGNLNLFIKKLDCLYCKYYIKKCIKTKSSAFLLVFRGTGSNLISAIVASHNSFYED